MNAVKSSFVHASLVQMGGIIGAGVFAIGPLFAKIGMVRGTALYVVAVLAAVIVHLAYLDVIAKVQGRHRFPGYIGKALGGLGEKIALITHVVHITGVQIAYIALGGSFVYLVSGRGGAASLWGSQPAPLLHQGIFWLLAVFCVIFGLRFLIVIESWLAAGLVSAMAVVIALGLGTRSGGLLWSTMGSSANTLGVFLFAVFGFVVIPEVFEITGRNYAIAKRAIFTGTLAAATLTWLFGYASALLQTSTLSEGMIFVLRFCIPLVGFLSILTAMILQTFDLEMTYRVDFKFSAVSAWVCSIGLALAGALILRAQFIALIGILGSFFTTTNAFLILAAYARLGEPRRRWWSYPALLPFVGASVIIMMVFLQRVTSLFIR